MIGDCQPINREYLVEYIGGRQVSVETERAGHAEAAAHFAARLRRDAQRSAVVLRDIDALYVLVLGFWLLAIGF